jgi:hypothetical protein
MSRAERDKIQWHPASAAQPRLSDTSAKGLAKRGIAIPLLPHAP